MKIEGRRQQMPGERQSWADRNGLSHGGIAILWLIAAFILFQLFAGLAAAILIVITTSAASGGFSAQQLGQLTFQHIELVFWGNTIGQLLFLALATWLFCRLQVKPGGRSSFLRLKSHDNTWKMVGIAFVLIIVIQPVIWFAGWLNSIIPMPHFMQSLQSQQMNAIKSYLIGRGHLWITLFNVALVPAFCEEILFRGYALRSFQKSWGVVAAIILTGVIFGLFHLEPANFLPLAGIGVLLAYLTWVTESIFPAMVAHFVNNGAGILVAKFYPNTAFASTTIEKMPSIGWLIPSIILSAFLLYYLMQNKMNPQRR